MRPDWVGGLGRLRRGVSRAGLPLASFAALALFASHARGDGVAQILTSKSIPPATVAIIDPESGTSSGGSSTDVRLAVGDIILFRFNYFPVPDQQIRGLAGYLTEFVPPNTEVVGIRFVDDEGRTVLPRYPGIANDGCARPCDGFDAVPCNPALGFCGADAERDLGDGAMAQLYADTGFFYSTDLRTTRIPASQFITLANGTLMDPDPTSVASIAPILSTSAPFFTHVAWDYLQVRAYGVSNPDGNASGNNGLGNTPFGYGSPVAGPQTFYRYEATQRGTLVEFNDVVGPWNRIVTPGSVIGTGVAATGTGSLARQILDASTSGVDITPATPLPRATQAIRAAMGEVRVGEPAHIEVALRVLGTPLDPGMMRDADCGEVFGGDTSGRSDTTRARDNPWSLYLASPACVFLNLLFDLQVDDELAVTGDTLTYTLHGRNLSINPQTGVVVRQKFDSTRVAFVSATGSPTMLSNCDGDGLACLVWNLGTLDPSEDYTFTSVFTVGGGGHVTNVMRARYSSTQLPDPGFSTQAINLVRAVPVVHATLDPTAASTAAGGTAALAGQVRNDGSGDYTLGSITLVLPGASWRSTGALNIAGTNYACSSGCATNRPTFVVNRSMTPGTVLPMTVSVVVPAGTATGLHDVDVQIWASTMAFGGEFETYLPDEARIPVGAVRSTPPVLDCPILSSASRIRGSTSEADGTDVRVRFNLIERGTDTNATGGRFDVGTFGSGSAFGSLYGGLEVRATAQAPGELESELSEPCFVTFVNACQDTIDNDGDGLIDFPEDPGCSGPTDSSETDPACSNGADDDMDGLTDYPRDPECSSPDDTTEGGAAACANGIDDDGDTLVDFPADPDCSSAADRIEATRAACFDGVDNDMDGRMDFGSDPGCDAINDDSELDFSYAAGDVRPRILLVFDTSGSMNWHVCADQFTGGDGSLECPGTDVTCATCSAEGCGNAMPDDSRIDRARRGVSDVIAGYGDVEYSLMRFHQRPAGFSCPDANASLSSGGWQGAGASPCGGGFAAGDVLVGFAPDNEYDLLEWMDGDDNYSGTAPAGLDVELRGSGTTPLAGSLQSALTYLSGIDGADPQGACRPYRVILLTDGLETCGGNPVTAAGALRAAGYPTYVIGFAIAAGSTAPLNAIASAGGTTSAIFADDSAELSAALANIVNESILFETCNGADDDCDTLIDEGYTLYCDRPGGTTTATLCVDRGERVCDGFDDNCNGRIDEGLLNACGRCGTVPAETCNRVDDDCDGAIDEAVCGGCVPGAELCNGLDDDCDGRNDEGLSRACGTDVGECRVGTETCTAGAFSGCTATGPVTETCNGLDDNCDGVVDGLVRPCGSGVGACEPGTETCTAGMFGTCVGGIGPTTEVCNGVDDDCDGVTDDGNPGGGTRCGSDIGACDPGTLTCVSGALTCTGGIGPVAELCNSTDDDCDTRTDEEVPPGGACGICGGGLLRCVGGMMLCQGDGTPTTEVCNGRDDDCDGNTDEGNPGGGAVCGTAEGECSPGVTACVAGVLECTGGVGPGTELCNSRDDDCDALIDEGNPEGGDACPGLDVGECDPGVRTCVAGMLGCTGVVGPSPERCDGLDNDCDGMVDEGDPGGGGTCGDDTGECMSGVEHCVDGAIACVGGVGPVEEVCNGLDDDCDGVVDDGLLIGAPCGTDDGECVPGLLRCMDGEIVCDGEIGPMTESCNGLDDDCDRAVDEALPAGGECGSMEGLCVPGMLQCVDGAEVCVGEVPRTREECDCEDDDCDGAVDENPSELCPAGAECRDCQCALPCRESEFGPCPVGTVPEGEGEDCYCVAPRCNPDTCAAEGRVEVDGEVLCAPDVAGAHPCVCASNRCTFACDGVDCAEPTVCNPADGTCVSDDCRGLGCPDGQLCDLVTLECIDDPCNTVECEADEACRGGTCEPSCATAECEDGEICRRGVCGPDLCRGVVCGAGDVCDPATGDCTESLCAGVMCPADTECQPLTGECRGNPCIGLHCPEGQMCLRGECAEEIRPMDAGPPPDGGPSPDGGMPEFDAGGDGEVRVLAAGGGGCLCAVPAGGTGGDAPALLGLLVLLGLLAARRARRSGGAS